MKIKVTEVFCNPEYSNVIEKLHKVKSLFVWSDKDKKLFLREDKKNGLSIYTDAELGIFMTDSKFDDFKPSIAYVREDKYLIAGCKYMKDDEFIRDENEANLRARLLIYMLNKLNSNDGKSRDEDEN